MGMNSAETTHEHGVQTHENNLSATTCSFLLTQIGLMRTNTNSFKDLQLLDIMGTTQYRELFVILTRHMSHFFGFLTFAFPLITLVPYFH